MKMLVLGAGLQGSACAYALLQHKDVTSVTLADHKVDRTAPFLADAGDRLHPISLDARDEPSVRKLMSGHTAVLCALPYYFNEPMTGIAIDAGCHFCDLGGNTDIVVQQQHHHDAAVGQGVSIIPDCGVAPGMVNILAAEGIRRLDQTESVRIYVGGLPQHPEPPLNYQIVYSLEGALDYYTTPSWILRGGKAVQVEALSELETQTFPGTVGVLEAFHTAGGISTLPFEWEGKIQTMEYKTLRYPGHVAIMRPIRELGLLDNTPINVKGQTVTPRDVFIAAVQPKLKKPQGHDLVALRVIVSGTSAGATASTTFELLDRYDETRGISAMMRTTGFSIALTGLMQANKTITAPGVHTPDAVVPFPQYTDGLTEYGVHITETH